MRRALFLSVLALLFVGQSFAQNTGHTVPAEFKSALQIAAMFSIDEMAEIAEKKYKSHAFVDQTFYLDLSEYTGECTVHILDKLGKNKFNQKLTPRKTPVFIGAWKAGSYTIMVNGKKHGSLSLQ